MVWLFSWMTAFVCEWVWIALKNGEAGHVLGVRVKVLEPDPPVERKFGKRD